MTRHDRQLRTVAEVQELAERARQRSIILMSLERHLRDHYLPLDGTPPTGTLPMHGTRVRARSDVVEELCGELLVAATIAAENARSLMQTDAGTLPRLRDERLFFAEE